jgi:hypothetical protein
MFQTNEGPSFPAHHFILSGDLGASGSWVSPTIWILSPRMLGSTRADAPKPHQSECYDHTTLVDQLKANNTTWRYYTPTPGVIWTAPAISNRGKILNGICAGPDFANVI